MANEFARNIQDYLVNPATFSLPNGVGSTQSAVVDLGADVYKNSNIEFELSVPTFAATTINPGTATAGVTYIIESSTTSTFAAQDQVLMTQNYAGSTTTAQVAKVLRCRPPSNCARYVRGKVTFGTTTGDGSAQSAAFTVRF